MATITTATTQSVRIAMAMTLKQNNCDNNTTGSLSNKMNSSIKILIIVIIVKVLVLRITTIIIVVFVMLKKASY